MVKAFKILLPALITFLTGEISGGNILAGAIAGGVADLAKDRLDNWTNKDATKQKIEELARSLVTNLAAVAAREGFEPAYLEQVAEGLLVAIDLLDLGQELARARFRPEKFAPVLVRALPAGTDATDSAAGPMVRAFAEELCRIAPLLPTYEQGKDQELLEQLDRLVADQAAVLRNVERINVALQADVTERQDVADQNERQYRAALLDFASRVKLLGLAGDRSASGRQLPIKTAYIPLRLRQRASDYERRGKDGRNLNVNWPEILALLPLFGNRLLIEGIGGSGKTTLLQWAAVKAVQSAKTNDGRSPHVVLSDRLQQLRAAWGALNGDPALFDTPGGIGASSSGGWQAIAWYDRVPLLVRLREVADGKLPSPEALPKLIAKTALGTPEAWVRRVIAEKRALFLLDGIDEVREEGREALAEHIKSYLRDFEGCPVIATSRPAAVQDAPWAELFGTSRLLVERMAGEQIQEFVRHWYTAYSIVREEERDEVAIARLLRQIEARDKLLGLMDTPLLAASICFLNKDRTDELPTHAHELYSQLCRQLVHQLDEERLTKAGYDALVPALRGLDVKSKLYLLAELAQLMVNNRSAFLDEEQAILRLGKALRLLGKDHDRDVSAVLHALQERSGLLRGSSPRTVEFAHNNLRAWLAAHAFAVADEHVLPVERAFDLKDPDLPMLASAQAKSMNYRRRLIEACLVYGDGHPAGAREAKIMALRCGQAGPIEESYRARLHKLAGHILPPRDADEAVWLSELGESIVDRLTSQPGRESKIDAACVRCLRLIGGAKAKNALTSYINSDDEDVLDELAKGLPPLTIPRVWQEVIGKRQTAWWYSNPVQYITLSDLRQANKDKLLTDSIFLSGADLTGIEFVDGVDNLRSLDVSETRISNLKPLHSITTLQNLNLSETQVVSLAPLCCLTALQSLELSRTQVIDLKPLCGLTALRILDLSGTNVLDLEPLRGLIALRELNLSDTKIVDLDPLRGMTALTRLDLSYIPLIDLEPLRGRSAPLHINLTGTKVVDIEPVVSFATVEGFHSRNGLTRDEDD